MTLLCQNTKAGSPVDMVLVAAIQGYAANPVLGGLESAAGNEVLKAAQGWCSSQGYVQ